MLSPEQIRFYRESGYVVLENFLSASQLEALQSKTAELTEKSRAVRVSDDVYELEDDHAPDRPRLQRIKAPHKVDPVYDGIIRDDRMLAVLRDLLGPSVRLQNSKLNLKSAGGTPVEWHQDWAFYPHTNDDVLAVGVMLDDMTPENGPLLVMPGSHKGPTWDHHADGCFAGAMDPAACPLDFAKAAMITGKAGACSFHHVRAIHGSAQNRSGADRNLLLYQVAAADAWDLRGLPSTWEESESRMIAGTPTLEPRVVPCPIRMPYPTAKKGGSIYENQSVVAHRYFDYEKEPA